MNQTNDEFVLMMFAIIEDLIEVAYQIDTVWREGDDYLVDGIVDRVGEIKDTYEIWRGDWYDERPRPEAEE